MLAQLVVVGILICTPAEKGFGLPDIVRGHSGFIEVDTEVGCGTTFKVHLPATPDIPDAKAAAAVNRYTGHGETILIADDEASFRSTVKHVLTTAGYRVLTAEDGAAAVAIFSSHREEVKAVLCNLIMPVLDGIAVVRVIKKIHPGVRVLVSSGLAEDSVQQAKIAEMLEMDLEVEKKAVEIYSRAHRVCTHEPTRYMLENHILDEDKDVEELQKLLGKVAIAQAAAPAEKKVAAARR